MLLHLAHCPASVVDLRWPRFPPALNREHKGNSNLVLCPSATCCYISFYHFEDKAVYFDEPAPHQSLSTNAQSSITNSQSTHLSESPPSIGTNSITWEVRAGQWVLSVECWVLRIDARGKIRLVYHTSYLHVDASTVQFYRCSRTRILGQNGAAALYCTIRCLLLAEAEAAFFRSEDILRFYVAPHTVACNASKGQDMIYRFFS
jgi:hypothetical protein